MKQQSDPIVQLENDTLLPPVPTQAESEQFFLTILSYVQQWGVLICVVGAVLCLITVQVFKVRKNPQSQRVWRFWGYGFIVIAVIFAFLPYIALRFY